MFNRPCVYVQQRADMKAKIAYQILILLRYCTLLILILLDILVIFIKEIK
jgi:hypothetical protein